ncbi:MAG: hypothetical protein ABF690_11810 [Liquorilactobacillus nagelii]|uniref:hypothetical protein n=1 Tax=Oenococcus sicerae TaxID=2203724 RepID=UPI0039ED5E33
MEKDKKLTVIIGTGDYPKIKNAKVPGNYLEKEEKLSNIKTVAFIPDRIDENINAFRRVISLIYKKEAENKIQEWKNLGKTGTEVAEEIFNNKNIMLLNIYDSGKDETEDIKNCISNNSTNLKVVLLGRIACDNLYDDISGKVSVENIVKYPHPTERSADYIYWRNIDYKGIPKIKKYDDDKTMINFFD